MTDGTPHNITTSRKQSDTDILDLSLRVNEIFLSIQGETSKTGLPTVFVRLTGCPLRCQYCDKAYAFHDGENSNVATIMERVRRFRTRHVTVTGGEPLAQKNCRKFLQLLCDEGFEAEMTQAVTIQINQT